MAETEAQEQRPAGFDEDLSGVAIPQELSILPLRGVVIFPAQIVPLLISRGSSLKLVEDCRKGDGLLGLAAQKNPDDENPPPTALFSRGCAGRILKTLKYPDGSMRPSGPLAGYAAPVW
jgi:ATP-dependent Lon protease